MLHRKSLAKKILWGTVTGAVIAAVVWAAAVWNWHRQFEKNLSKGFSEMRLSLVSTAQVIPLVVAEVMIGGAEAAEEQRKKK